MIIHVVNTGDTLTSIATQYGLTATYIQQINQLPNPENLVIGQSIIILYPEISYTAKQGDTLNSISKKFGVSLIQLLRNNPYLASRVLETGDMVVIYFKTEYLGTAETNGYAYQYIDKEYLRSVLPYLTYLTIFTYGFRIDGTLVEIDDLDLIELARIYGVAPIMNFSTLGEDGTFSSERASTILRDESLQEILINNIIKVLKEKNYYGIDIDFEYVLPEDSLNYSNFVEKLTNQLNANNLILIASLAPKTSATQKGTLYEGHNYLAIGNAANIAFLMTYEWGYTYGPPMAVAPINKVKEVLDYAITEIPPEKTLMGIPTYGYVWKLPYERGTSKAMSLSAVAAIELAVLNKANILYDYVAQSPYFYFTDVNGIENIVWFEDARSSQAKHHLIKEYNLLGCGYWNIDRPFPQNWMVLNSMYNILQVPVVLSSKK